MDNQSEIPTFEARGIIEQRPFESPVVQSYFNEWCKINDSITPQILSRGDWEERGIKGVLEKGPDEKQTLFLPDDLKLWEMVGVMEVIDHDTFAVKPERKNEKKEELLRLAKLFQNSGIYIAQRLNVITEGQVIAEALAEEFYEYGQLLEYGKIPNGHPKLDEIASYNLSLEDIEKVDSFLAGESLYNSRLGRVKQPNDMEDVRTNTLAQFFKVAEKAIRLKQKTQSGEAKTETNNLEPWKSNTPIHNAFLTKIRRAMVQKIETPRRELETAIFRRGLERLVTDMKERGWKHSVNSFFGILGINLRFEQRKIADIIKISKLKSELEDVRKTGDVKKISALEHNIANKVQGAVSGFPYQKNGNNPSEMVVNQFINCVGASILGGALMKEAGLNYLVGNLSDHSVLLLLTEDGRLEWRDMQNPSAKETLTDEMIDGKKQDGSLLTISDITAFSQNSNMPEVMFDLKTPNMKWVKNEQRHGIVISRPEYGQQIRVLINMGNAFFRLGNHEKAIEAYRQATAMDLRLAPLYYNLGFILQYSGSHEEAVEVFRHAAAIDTKYSRIYYGLGESLSSLGRKKEAIESFQKYIDQADKEMDRDWIDIAKKNILVLKIMGA